MSQKQTSLHIDPFLLLVVTALSAFGVVLVYSSSAVFSAQQGAGPTHYFVKHLIGWGIALVLAALVWMTPIDLLRRRAGWLFVATTLLVGLTFLPGFGVTVGGARRWVGLLGMRFQPSEWVKFAAVLVVASALAAREERKRQESTSLWPAFLIVQLPIALVLLGRDLGSAVVMELIVIAMLYAAGLRLRTLLAVGLMGLPLVYYFVFSETFRLKRLVAYLDPWAYRSSFGYQVTEALISIGSGGVLGVGLGESKHKLFFLPEAHTDFPFAILAEELGLIGAGLVLLGYALFLLRGTMVALAQSDAFRRHLAWGCVLIVAVPALINVCVATGLLPTKGLALPLLSYGRSNLLATVVSLALLLKMSGEMTAATPAKRGQA